jgi:hypothetical protein
MMNSATEMLSTDSSLAHTRVDSRRPAGFHNRLELTGSRVIAQVR